MSDLSPALVQVIVAVLACCAITYTYKVYARAAMAYGYARSSDHRPVRLKNWRQAGLESIWPIVGIDAMALILAVPLLTARWALSHYVEPAVYQPGLTQLIISVVGNLLIMYAGLGLLISTWLGRYAVALGGFPSRMALKTGLSLYFGSFTRVLWAGIVGLLGAGVISGAYVGLLALLAQAADYMPYKFMHLLASGLIIVLYIGTLAIAASAYGMTIYRGLVACHFREDLGRLVTGRQAAKPRKPVVVWLILSAAMLTGLVLLAALMPQNIINVISSF